MWIFFAQYKPMRMTQTCVDKYVFPPPICTSFLFCPCVNAKFYSILPIFLDLILEENSHTKNLSLPLTMQMNRPMSQD